MEHGDLTTNIAMILSKKTNKNPLDIAQDIIKLLKDKYADDYKELNIAGPGFINVKLNQNKINELLKKVKKENLNYGKRNDGKNKQAIVEFVSANPTGPLTVGHGRGAIIGDVVSRILEWCGYKVDREYYFNNAGRQMRVLGESVYARYMEILGHSYAIPEGGYEGEYIKNIASNIYDECGNSLENKKDDPIFKERAENLIFKDIEKTLLKAKSFSQVHPGDRGKLILERKIEL